MAIADLDGQFRNIDQALWAETFVETASNQGIDYDCSDTEARDVLGDIPTSQLIAGIIYDKYALWHEGVRMVDDAYIETEQEREDRARFPFVNLHPRPKPIETADLKQMLRHYNYGLVLAGTALRILTRTDIAGIVPDPELVLSELMSIPPEVAVAATHSTVERSRTPAGEGMPYIHRPYPAVEHLMWRIDNMDPQSFAQTGRINAFAYREGEASASLFFWSIRSIIDGAQLDSIVNSEA